MMDSPAVASGQSAAPVLVCLDSFKGSVSAVDASTSVARGIRLARPDATVLVRPVADGGEGTVAALLALGWAPVTHTVIGPDGGAVTATSAVRDGTAVVELAEAAGIGLLRSGPRPLTATTFGVGQMIRALLDEGCRTFVLALGGSATTDGGAGLLSALGARFLDDTGHTLEPGLELGGLAELDLANLDPRLHGVDILIASDVDNPLLGARGAASVYAPQKGAGPEQVSILEARLARFASLVSSATGTDLAGAPGAGAAGGTGFGVLATLGGRLRSGAEWLLELTGVDREIPTASLVVVGEGRLDHQSLSGKAPLAITRHARAAGVPVVAVAGSIALSEADLRRAGIIAGLAVTDVAPDLAAAVADAPHWLELLGRTLAERHLAERHLDAGS